MIKPLFQSAYDFPDPEEIDPDHSDLVAIGADLEAITLLHAYSIGIFPWFNEGDDIRWFSPSPRCVLYPEQYKPSKTLLREMKKAPYTVKINQNFAMVMNNCAAPRAYCGDDTWIGPSMKKAYNELHELGIAISIEIWENDEMIGGLYGEKMGQAFFGESMFHKKNNASKMAFFVLAQLCKHSAFKWIDCQLPNEHLISLGAVELERKQFLQQLETQVRLPIIDWSELYTLEIPLQLFLNEDMLYLEDYQLKIRS